MATKLESESSVWSISRRGKVASNLTNVPSSSTASEELEHRTPFERDYDRLLFSTPVRRMADKTQVFPLEKNDSVRTRLTHCHEVSNLARSIGNRLLRKSPNLFGEEEIAKEAPVVLATVGLAHDLGNPPFGHQGEVAIRRWFDENQDKFSGEGAAGSLSDDQAKDFLEFEGNAQTLRLLSKLQVSVGGYGLDLTAATLAAVMKYTVPASKIDRRDGAAKSKSKSGYFLSEQNAVDWIWAQTGLDQDRRHPLTWLMEACDDIAYSVLDIEDAIKKDIISPEDVLAFIKRECSANGALIKTLMQDFEKADQSRVPSQAHEIKNAYLRTRLIEALIIKVAEAYLANADAIRAGQYPCALLDGNDGPAAELYKKLKSFALKNAYQHPSVLKLELEGSVAIRGLMDMCWRAVTEREKIEKPGSRRQTPLAAFVYSRISDNYRAEFEFGDDFSGVPLRYRELQLVTDMISGMTDSFVIDLHEELREFRDA